ncbi:hypothetical protein [Actinokineospora cianjurensis]|uniref:Uncharacterized protein n=1 Tax=Actinokineospora cianjurensis TaxID=585224 RepID=A0A421B2S4_9PSEU|nr:hypothetical protein [Actinokineospora cianjurensis]RLK58712.1 hypothetical protein CLV68_3187 [Actinokineospora cianjurensis]
MATPDALVAFEKYIFEKIHRLPSACWRRTSGSSTPRGGGGGDLFATIGTTQVEAWETLKAVADQDGVFRVDKTAIEGILYCSV